MARQTIAIALPTDEQGPVERELAEAGYDTIVVQSPDELGAVLETWREVAVAILDGENDFDRSLEFYSLLHADGRDVPVLMVVSPRTLDRLSGAVTKATINDEFFTRPYSADALRWRIEAMLIRSHTVDDGAGAIIESDHGIDSAAWAKRATVIAVFNPKGGVGKTTLALNLAAALRVHRDQRVLLIDADTVTGHISTSLGLDRAQTVVDAWAEDREDGVELRAFSNLATQHPNGLEVVMLTSSPLDTEVLDAQRVGEAIAASRRGRDFVIIDMHPSYGEINKVVFERADQILVPITPDLPAIKAGVQFTDVADRLGIRDKLAMVVNRANSGVAVEDMERTVGMPALALIRSGGLLFVRAANEGRTVVEQFPKERVTEDFDALADQLLGSERKVETARPPAARTGFRLFNRAKEAARA
jgi:pilus assembly protein CpaE